MEIGKVTPGYEGSERASIWRCPIEVYDSKRGTKFKVVQVYTDEGFLLIDVEEDNG